MTIYICTTGLNVLSDENEAKALKAGAVPLSFGQWPPVDGIVLYHSTVGWTGISRGLMSRIARFRNFDTALRRAIRESQQAT